MFSAKLYQLISYPHSYREALVRLFMSKFPKWRPHYYLCLQAAARQAITLGIDRLTVIEFGVSGGNGLLALERYSKIVEKKSGVAFDIYGFDMGDDVGLPESTDHRDLLHLWQPGDYKMNLAALEDKLTFAKLVLGDVNTTLNEINREDIAPLAVCCFDLDYYTSTIAALRVFILPNLRKLPRIYSYFDDIEVSSKFTGVQCAISDFNDQNNEVKIDKMYGHHHDVNFGTLSPKVFTAHNFSHKSYNVHISGQAATELPLK